MTRKSITISVIAGFSGAYGPAIQETYKHGFVTWQKQVNAAGGIYGRQVVIKQVDHKETADGGVAACREAMSNGSYLVITVQGQGDGNGAAANCLDKQGVTNLAYVSDRERAWRHTYTVATGATDQGRSLASFVKNVMGDGGRKLGVIYLTPKAYVATKDAYVSAARALGLKVVDTEAIEPNQASFTPQLLRLRDAGATNVAIIATTEALGVLRDAKSLGYTPHWAAADWVFDFFSEAARDLAKGVQGLRFSVTTDGPAWTKYQQVEAKYSSTSGTFREGLLYYGDGLLVQRVLEAAGPNPVGGGLARAIESVKNYDNGILPPITWGPGDFVGPVASFPAICCTPNWDWQGLGPARERF